MEGEAAGRQEKNVMLKESMSGILYIYLHLPPKLPRSGSMDPRLSVFGIFLLRMPGVAQQDVRPRRDSESAGKFGLSGVQRSDNSVRPCGSEIR